VKPAAQQTAPPVIPPTPTPSKPPGIVVKSSEPAFPLQQAMKKSLGIVPKVDHKPPAVIVVDDDDDSHALRSRRRKSAPKARKLPVALIAGAAGGVCLLMVVGVVVAITLLWPRPVMRVPQPVALNNLDHGGQERLQKVEPEKLPKLPPEEKEFDGEKKAFFPPVDPGPIAVLPPNRTEPKQVKAEPVPEWKPLPLPGPEVGAIRPCPLKNDVEERQLPSTVADTCIGGGGRFWIMHLPAQRQLAVFDVNEARVVKYFSVAEDEVKFAAGMNHLYMVFPDKGIIQRFSLATFEKQVTAQVPFTGTVRALATGSAASGPLLVHYNEGQGALGNAPVALIDPVTFKELNVGGLSRIRHSVRDAYHYRAGPDGTVFGSWVTSHSQSMSSIVVTGTTARVYQGEMAGSVVPSAENTLVAAGGLYTPECTPLLGDKAQPRYRLRVPSQTGRFYITCPGGGGAQINTGTEAGSPADVYLMGDSRPIATLSGVTLPTSNEAWTRSDFTQDKRVLFVPEAKLIAIIPNSNDRVVLHRFDIEQALAKTSIEFLFVVSRPPSTAYKGAQFTYAPRVKSKNGGVKLKVESGPEGMKAGADSIVWNVPKDFADGATDVILTVSDAGGQEVFHSFKLTISDRPPPNTVQPPPPALEPKEVKVEEPPAAKQPPLPDHARAIVPPNLDAEKVVRSLPASLDDLAVGGGGRFLLLNFPSLRKIGLFDVNEAKVVHYFPVGGNGVKFTAGLTKLIMVFPDTRIAQRWDLFTRERELTVTLPVGHDVNMALMGSASEGPLVVGAGGYYSRGQNGITFLDIQSFKPVQLNKQQFGHRGFITGFTRVSADGAVFATWEPGLSPQGLQSYVIIGRDMKGHYEHDSVGHIVPGPDGKHLYTARGIFTNECKPVGNSGERINRYVLPAVHGDFYMQVNFGSRFDRDTKKNLSVYMVNDARPMLNRPDILADLGDSDNAFNSWGREAFGNDKRLHLIPAAKLFVSIPFSNDRLIAYRFDVEQILEQSGVDYLYVTSRAPAATRRGGLLQYPIVVRSKRGGVKYKLDAGPEGMTVDGRGLLSWNVPADLQGEQNVILSISDSSGQEIFHTFKLDVLNVAPAVNKQ